MERAPLTEAELDELARRIDAWLDDQLTENPTVASVEADSSGERRWFVRLLGEEKSVFTVWVHLKQRLVHAETYLMPFPEENRAECFEYLMRRSRGLVDYRLCIADEDAVYLTTEFSNEWVDHDVIDRLLGGAYQYTEQLFRPAMRIAFPTRFNG